MPRGSLAAQHLGVYCSRLSGKAKANLCILRFIVMLQNSIRLHDPRALQTLPDQLPVGPKQASKNQSLIRFSRELHPWAWQPNRFESQNL